MLIEVCVESLSDAVAAERLGAGRIELCASLDVGGTTPSVELMRAAVAQVQVPVVVMIRPRGGEFIFTEAELDIMCRDIDSAQAAGVSGIVTGVLGVRQAVDRSELRRLCQAAGSLPVTFHRAIDLTPDIAESLQTCLESGVSRILTSGGAARAIDGVQVLRQLLSQADGRLTVIAGGGVRADHVQRLITESGVTEIHLGPRRPLPRDSDTGRDESELDVHALAKLVEQVRGRAIDHR